jgi:hypothetical protein
MTEEISADLALAESEARESRDRLSDLRAAAQAVVDRWDTPLWKNAPSTGEYINALRAALLAPAVPPGWKMVPVIPTVEIVCAIEDTVQAQLDASAIHALVHRLDGEVIWDLALAAAPSAKEPTCPKN